VAVRRIGVGRVAGLAAADLLNTSRSPAASRSGRDGAAAAFGTAPTGVGGGVSRASTSVARVVPRGRQQMSSPQV